MAEGWKKRLIAEQKELKEKIDRLATFIRSDEFAQLSAEHSAMLNLQLAVMRRYDYVLRRRINLF